MFSIKKALIYFLLIFLLMLATWSVGQQVFSFQSVLRLINPAEGMEDGVNIPRLVLHLGLVFLFVKEIGASADSFFAMEQYILIKKKGVFFAAQCGKYVLKYSFFLWSIVLIVELMFLAGEMKENADAFLFLNGSIGLTVLLWAGAWILLRLLHFSSRGAMLGLLLLICVSTYFSGSLIGGVFALCPAGLLLTPLVFVSGKLGALLLVTVGIYLVSRKYESIGE